MASTQFGLNVSASVEPGVDPVREAQAAEELGFDFVSVNDHMHGPERRYECWTLLSWIAANTSRVRVASRVLGLQYRAPAVTAKMAETFARLSGGRLILGLGAGSGEDEYLALGLDAPPLRERLTGLEEAIQITRGLWSAATLTYAGSVFRVNSSSGRRRAAEERCEDQWRRICGGPMGYRGRHPARLLMPRTNQERQSER